VPLIIIFIAHNSTVNYTNRNMYTVAGNLKCRIETEGLALYKKRCKIQTLLLQTTNMKLIYMAYGIAPFLMTLSDLQGHSRTGIAGLFQVRFSNNLLTRFQLTACRAVPLPAVPPSPLQSMTSLKVLGVTLTDRLSVTAHVDDVIGSCARSMYAISVLRSHGMEASALQQVFRAVVVSKLTYAAPAWWGFTTSVDRPRIDAVLRRAARSDLWTSAGMSDAQTFEDLCNSADEELFIKIRTFSNHILHALLPPPSTASQNYSLRHREQ